MRKGGEKVLERGKGVEVVVVVVDVKVITKFQDGMAEEGKRDGGNCGQQCGRWTGNQTTI